MSTHPCSLAQVLRLLAARFNRFRPVLLSLLVAGSVAAQNGGQNSPNSAVGSPAGSYQLSGFENVNLYSGNLNFNLPLLQIGGRGEARTVIGLSLNSVKWKVIRDQADPVCSFRPEGVVVDYAPLDTVIDCAWIHPPDPNSINCSGEYLNHFLATLPDTIGMLIDGDWFIPEQSGQNPIPPRYYHFEEDLSGAQVGYAPGVMQAMTISKGGRRHSMCPPIGPDILGKSLTRLVFTTADGTQYELRDAQTGGQPHQPQSINQTYSRGTVFVTADGTAATFISDSEITEVFSWLSDPVITAPSGLLLLADGTRYRIEAGRVVWMRDRNGNLLTFTYGTDPNNAAYGRLISIHDSLDREITIDYDIPYDIPYAGGTYDQLNFSGFNDVPRFVKVWHTSLQPALRSGYSIQTFGNLFPAYEQVYPNEVYDPEKVVSAVELPDGRRYELHYDPYNELSRVMLPTGGAIEYEYDTLMNSLVTKRRIAERRVYVSSTDTVPESKTSYSTSFSGDYMAPATTITVKQWSGINVLSSENHSFYGSSVSAKRGFYSSWFEGLEFKTEIFDANNVLQRRVTKEWRQRTAFPGFNINSPYQPPVDPRLVETVTTLENGQKSRQSAINPQTGEVGFDQYNNQTDVWEYDYSVNTQAPNFVFPEPSPNPSPTPSPSPTTPPIPPVRHTHTDFLAVNPANGIDYTTTGVHIRRLPKYQATYAVNPANGSETLMAQSSISYDESAYPLLTYSGVTSWADPGTPARGNPTTTANWLNPTNSYLFTHAQYDQCGNARNVWDAKGNQSQKEYSSAFIYNLPTLGRTATPDPSGQHGSNTPFLATNDYDPTTGLLTSVTDAGGVITTTGYNDPLDRATQIIRGANQSPEVKNQTTFAYDDASRTITTTSDQTTFNDNALKSQVIYDGLGRTIETRTYEGGNNYIAVRTQYDALGRAFKVSTPFRPWLNETPVWTTSAFDALGRMISVTTPDGAVVTTSYSGNAVTVTDQAGKLRRSITNALGQLVRVDEPDSNGNLGTINNPTQPTSYTYDALGNLRTVTQGAQQRFFAYDSLSRLIRAHNPEQAVNTNLPALTDPVSGNSQWSMAYSYDANGSLTSKIDSRTITSTYAYDALNRATTRSYSDGTPAVTYTYDSTSIPNAKGRLVSVSSSVSSYSYGGYDALGRAVSGTQTIGSQSYTVGYTYNKSGSVLTETYPSGRVATYVYDSAGRNNSFTGNLGDGSTRTYSTGITYASAGQMAQEQFGTTTPVYNKLFYNSRQQLSEIRASTTPNDTSWNRGAIINQYSNQCWGAGCNGTDNNGNLKQQEVYVPNNDQVTSYTSWAQVYDYDSLNRLTQVHEYTGNTQLDWQQAYSYDRWGNRTINGGMTYGSGINNAQATIDQSNNRLYATNDSTHTLVDYDAAGNQLKDYLTSNGTRVYDAENRMITATNNSLTNTYSYDGDGRRVKRNVAGTETWQVYGLGGELLAEYAANGSASSPQKEYGYRNGQLLVTADEGASRTNFALASNGGTATASSVLDPVWGDYPPSKLIDGTRRLGSQPYSIWVDNTFYSFPDWVEVAFNGSKTIDEIDVITRPNDGEFQVEPSLTHTFSMQGATAFDVQYWNGSAWTPVTNGSVTGNNKLWRQFTFTAVTTSKIRLLVNDSEDHVLSRLAEIEAWGGGPAANIHWLITDQLGTPRMVFDQSGSLANVSRHDYLPFGEEMLTGQGLRTAAMGYSASDYVRQKFTLKERDNETGLDYFGARYYASTQGRFTSVDPIKLTPERIYQPQRLNLYSYTINNPLNLIDPDGKDIDFINHTKEGRRKALLSITANMTAREAKNVGVRWNKDTQKYEGYVKNPSKIDLGTASQGYQDFSDRVNNHDLKLNYAFMGKGDSVTIEMNGVQTKVTQKTLASGDSNAFLAPQSDGSFTAIVGEGGSGRGVLGLTPSGREVPVAMPDFLSAAHELFAETYKYTPAGIKEGLNNPDRVVDDSNKVIEIENKYRDFHGLPRRSGTDHGYIHAGTVTVRP